MKRAAPILALAIGGVLACGGGGGADAPASGLVYVDPSGPGYRFVRNPELSSATHLVLDLMGPDGDRARGVAFTLELGAGPARWAKVAPEDPQYLENLLFDLGPGIPLLKSALQGDTTLLADAFQKGPGNEKVMAGPICRVALDSQGPPSGANISISVVRFQLRPPTGAGLADAPCAVGKITFLR